MGSYIQGNEVTLYEQFLDPAGVPDDPTTVTFSVRNPAGSVVAYVFGVDAEVVKQANDVDGSPFFGATDGFFVCNLGAVSMAGVWHYRPEGSGAVVSASEYEFEIEASSTIAPVSGGPQFGPWVIWCDPQDVIDRCAGATGSDTGLFDAYCLSASQVLFEMGGRQHPGLSQPTTVRPAAAECGCWPWNETWHSWGQVQWGFWTWDAGMGRWGCGAQDKWSGCDGVSKIRLAGVARQIVEVKVGGVVVDPSLYRLDENKFLVRMRDPATPNQNEWWPGCQIQNLPDTEPGTFSVTYRYGIDPPQIAVDAAADLACQFWRATPAGGGDCQLPQGVTRAVRQGLTIDRSLFGQWRKENGKPWQVGIPSVDAYLNAYNPQGIRRRATVSSPWVTPLPLKPGV